MKFRSVRCHLWVGIMGVGPMSSLKGTVAYREEYVLVHFGIVVHTGLVGSVWQRRDGILSGVDYSHTPRKGRTIESELSAVFGLTEICTLPIQNLSARGSAIRRELEGIALRRKFVPDSREWGSATLGSRRLSP